MVFKIVEFFQLDLCALIVVPQTSGIMLEMNFGKKTHTS